MKQHSPQKWSISLAPVVLFTLVVLAISCQKNKTPLTSEEVVSAPFKQPQQLKDFQQFNLVANNNEYGAVRVEPNLVNAWGIAFAPSGIAWVNSEATGLSFLYDKTGTPPRAPVAIPGPATPTGGHPTGIVFNGSSDFKLLNGNPARFIFVGVDGVLSGWNSGNFAERKANNSATSAYTGLAIGNDAGANFLYAANFRTGNIDVFDKDYVQVFTKPFTDPNLPAGYSPFNIQNVGGKLYVMYAKVDPATGEEDAHPGFGIVDIYNTNGILDKRFTSNGQLNAPWGVAKAPPGFFADEDGMSDVILVGNFGDGHINAFNSDGRFLGQLRAHGQPVEIEGLWAISFAPTTATTIDPNWLFFAAGPDDEEDGLFGYITK